MKSYYVYIMASQRNGTLYVGVTSNLKNRIEQHKSDVTEGFTKRYNVKMLVYFERTESVEAAISREKQLKNWHRSWKIELIEKENPTWQDLTNDLW